MKYFLSLVLLVKRMLLLNSPTRWSERQLDSETNFSDVNDAPKMTKMKPKSKFTRDHNRPGYVEKLRFDTGFPYFLLQIKNSKKKYRSGEQTSFWKKATSNFLMKKTLKLDSKSRLWPTNLLQNFFVLKITLISNSFSFILYEKNYHYYGHPHFPVSHEFDKS